MDKLTRNALRLALAGAGVAVLGAGLAGQASAAEAPAVDGAPDTAGIASAITGSMPKDNSVSIGGQDLSEAAGSATPATTRDAASQPTLPTPPSAADTQSFPIPGVADLF